MIYYFSGTGNSKWVATQLACKTQDVAVNITEVTESPCIDKTVVGLVFPIYAWGAPEPVLTFVKQLQGIPSFSFAVATCGEDTGNALRQLNRLFPLHSQYSIAMPSNYIIGADVESPREIGQKREAAKTAINRIATQITMRQTVQEVNKGRFAFLKSTLGNFGFNRFARTTKPFFATDACTGCGLCQKNCPAKTIVLANGKPHWGPTCYQCTACLNRCPEQAVQYGRATATRGRYQWKDV